MDLRAHWNGKAYPDVGTDQEPARIGCGILLFHLAEQDPSANLKEVGGKCAFFEGIAGALLERFIGFHRALKKVREYAVVLEQAE